MEQSTGVVVEWKSPLVCLPIYIPKGEIKSHSNGKVFNSMSKVNRQSSNLIYVITCKSCGIQYVGQTKNRLMTRFQGHFNDIAHDHDTTVARHLNRCIPETIDANSGNPNSELQ